MLTASLPPQISVVLVRETEIAKLHLAAGNKNLALLALKKKKYQESLLDSTANQLLNLEQLVIAKFEYSRGHPLLSRRLALNSHKSKPRCSMV